MMHLNVFTSIGSFGRITMRICNGSTDFSALPRTSRLNRPSRIHAQRIYIYMYKPSSLVVVVKTSSVHFPVSLAYTISRSHKICLYIYKPPIVKRNTSFMFQFSSAYSPVIINTLITHCYTPPQ